MAWSCVYMRAIELNPLRSPERIRLPASQLNGLSASGVDMRAMMALQTDCSVQAGVHDCSLRMSRQISPVCAAEPPGQGERFVRCARREHVRRARHAP